MKSVMNRYACLVSVLVLFTLCNVAPAAVMDMYVTYFGGVKKYAYDTTTHVATEDESFSLLTVAEQLIQPQGIVVGPDNLLYVAGQDSLTVSRYNRTTGEFIDVLATWAGGKQPTGISFGPDNSGDGVADLYVSQWTNTVDRVPTAGADAGTIYTFTSGGSLTASSDVAIGPDNNLYAVGVGTFVEKFDGVTGTWLSTFATQTDNAMSLDFSADGSSLFTTRYVKLPNGGINKFDGVTGTTIAEPFGTGITYGASAVWGPDHNDNGVGDIYVGHPISPDNGDQVDVIDGLTGASIGPVITEIDRPKYVTFAAAIEAKPGDANRDGVVDDDDASILAANWLGSEKGWGDGDFNEDGVVNDLDATLMATNWTGAASAASVPEPSSAILLVSLTVGLFGLGIRRRS